MVKLSSLVLSVSFLFSSQTVFAQTFDAASTATAVRLNNTITGGLMPVTDPSFTTMVNQIASGNLKGAAATAAASSFAASYLYRRLALEMQIPTLVPTTITDSDATAFLIAHFAGTPSVKPSISTIWSDYSTYLVNVTANGTTTATHAASLTATQLATVNWSSSLVGSPGQKAFAPPPKAGQKSATQVTIPQVDSGGYTTLSDRANDTSFAMYGALAGTNLRMIEGIWEIATGLTLVDVESTVATSANVPRFVPAYDPSFFHGQGQAACISCHGGGMSSLTHGYSTVADKYDFDPVAGLVYYTTQATATMKSLGSNPGDRANNAACDFTKTPTANCNPDSVGADPNQKWDLTSWNADGVLKTMGWKSQNINGAGLNSLGTSIGQADLVYQFMVQRVVSEICPLGDFSPTEVQSIAAAADPFAVPAGTDNVQTIIALVASDSSCQ